VLEEAEFFASQGLYADAEAILADMLIHAPDHVLLREQLSEVRAALSDLPPESRNKDRDSLIPEDNAFDIAASLDALDDLDEPDTSPSMTSPDQEVDVDQVFAKFKEGVKAVVDDSDAATHHDLGLAYKEMGLQVDAISEFELASRDPARACMCLAMIDMIYREMGDTKKARDAFQNALKADQKSRDQELGIKYDIALLYQAEGAGHDYLKTLKDIARLDPNYRDVGARIRALGESVPERGEDQEQDEFDAAFDNLLG
jgi:tetratricopeptide (TPR) repeat protein